MGKKLGAAFYRQTALRAARALLGLWLVSHVRVRRRVGRILETEAYGGPRDLASHTSKGITPRTRILFGAPGYAYVYRVYGLWSCVNVVVGGKGRAHSVLIRAVQIVEGPVRGTVAGGPGLVCRALGIGQAEYGQDLIKGGRLWLERPPGPTRPLKIVAGPRRGVDYAGDWALKPWRFRASD